MSSHMTIQSFASEIQMSVEYLIQQFLNIGITKTKFDFVTQSERDVLLRHMRRHNIAIFDKFSLQRKTHSTLNVSSIGGKNKKIQVEVRKKRTYMVQSAIKNIISRGNTINILKNTNKSDIDCKESVGVIKKNIPIINNNVNSTVLLNQVSQQSDESFSNIIEHKGQCDMQISCKNDIISKDMYYRESKLNDHKHDLSKCNIKDASSIQKIKINNINKSDRVLIAKVRNNDRKLEGERQYNTNTRVRYKVVGKTIKHKRNNNNRSYIDLIDTEFYSEEKLCSTNRIYRNKRKQSAIVHRFNKPMQMISRNIVVGETISVLELSDKMSVKSSYMIKIMMKLGLMVTVNQILDQETAQLVIEEMGHNAILRHENELESLVMKNGQCDNTNGVSISSKDRNNIYKIRPPIVTIMGHVDHGKTSLLDCIRSINTVKTEFGGITQSIKSYRVTTKRGDMITFIDTPGHEAFAKMRMRGAKLTDIVVLVVAADDGVMPQTIESIRHIQSANIPTIVAINKIDKVESNVDVIKHALNKYGLISEEWGGNTQFVNVSARSGFGIDDLLDAILLQSEVLELNTAHHGIAKGIIIEGFLDKGRGPVVIVLIREGELKCGDTIVCGTEYGRVKAMYDEFGNNVFIAGPSIPVELLGLSGIPDSGETMIVLSSEKQAKELALYRKNKRRALELTCKQEVYSDSKNIFDNINSSSKIVELNFIVKSDTKGSIEAICESLKKLSTSEIVIKIIFSSIGRITETDSVLASTSNAILLAFNVKPDSSARRIIGLRNIKIYYFSVIYDLLDEVKRIINSMLVPKNEYKIIGTAEVHNIFSSVKYGTVAGCVVTDGVIRAHKKIKLIRNNITIHEGELESLRRFKNDVHEVRVGTECGIVIKNHHDICSGDLIKVLDKFVVSYSSNL